MRPHSWGDHSTSICCWCCCLHWCSNWPIFLHFYRILSALEACEAGFALSTSLRADRRAQRRLPAVHLRVSAPSPFFTPADPDRLLAQLRHAQSTGSSSMWAWCRNVVPRPTAGGGLLPQRLRGAPGSLLTGVLPVLCLLWIPGGVPEPLGTRGWACASGGISLSLLFLLGVAALYHQDYASVGRNNLQHRQR